MPLKTKGYKNVVRFDFFDNAKCSAFLDDAPKPVFKIFFDHFIKNTVCGTVHSTQYTLSKVGPNNHVSIIKLKSIHFKKTVARSSFLSKL